MTLAEMWKEMAIIETRLANKKIKFRRRIRLAAGEHGVAGVGTVFKVVEQGKGGLKNDEADMDDFKLSEVLATRFVANEAAEVVDDKTPVGHPKEKKS